MTINEIYEIGKSKNSKINKIMERIPSQVEYVIRENCLNMERDELLSANMRSKSVHFYTYNTDYKYAMRCIWKH